MSRVIWKLKSCPRCGGDTFVDRDMEGWYEQCLQCGCRCELKRLESSKLSRAASFQEQQAFNREG